MQPTSEHTKTHNLPQRYAMIRLPCADCTIAERLKLLNASTFAFIIVLVVSNYGQLLSLEKKIITLQQFQGFVEDVLELRRYEKDFLLDVGTNNIEMIHKYLARITVTVERLEPQLKKLSSPEGFRTFIGAMQHYRICMKSSERGSIVSGECLHKYGRIMVEFATDVLEKKKAGLEINLKTILYTFTIVPATLVILMIWGLFSQTRSVLNRIAFVQKATQDILRGDFTPIQDTTSARDEIHGLIQSFNKMAMELDTKTHELIQAEKLAAIGTFSSGIAHELNNPLNNISLSADMLLEDLDMLSKEEIKEILQDILTQTDRAGAIVRNLLDFSRDKEAQVQEIEVRDLIKRTIKLIENELRLNHIHIDTWIPDELPKILGDFQKLQQVFLNLFVNAIHAMPDGGLIYIDARYEEQGYVRIDVSDTGEGIPQEVIKKIFDPFFTTKEVGAGTGLGLSIIYGIVQKHGGYIEVSSKLKQGTTFSIYLPAVRRKEDVQEA